MKRKRLRTFAALVSASVCVIAGAAAGIVHSQTPGSCEQFLAGVREYGRYEGLLGTWVTLVAPKKPSTACLVGFATKFHEEYPGQNFEMFDAAGYELTQYVHWASTGMKDSDPYPEKWLHKHQFATLQRMSDSEPCGHWYLYDGKMSSLRQYERVKCAFENR